MILCSPCSLGRRRGEVGVRVGIGVIGVGVIVVVFGVGIGVGVILILILVLLQVLLRAPWRTIMRHPIVGGDVLLGGVVGGQFILAGQWAVRKLDGVV